MRSSKQFQAGHFSDLIPSRAGVWVLIWKDWAQAWRGIDIKSIIFWVLLFASGIGMLIAQDWGTRIWIFVVWGLLTGQICSKRFSSDLKLWVVFRLLPFSSRETLIVEIVSPVIGATLLCWIAFGICSLAGFHPSLPVAVIAPGIILCFALAAIFDILHQSKTDTLLAGQEIEMGVAGLFIGLFVAGVPLSLVLWLSNLIHSGVILWITSLFGLFISLGISFGMWKLAEVKYKNIK